MEKSISRNFWSLILAVLSVTAVASVKAETVLITGANRGIGLEFVRQYATEGWTVIATARDPAGAVDLQGLAKKEPKVKVEALDVTQAAQIASLAAKYRGTTIDVLINNAGVYGDRGGQTFGQYDEELLRDMVSVNVFGPLKVSEGFVEHVAASGQKKIVVISSLAGSIASITRASGAPYYAISKAAVNMAMRRLAETLRSREIAVSILHPGGVDTRMLRQAFGMAKDAAEASIEAGLPMPGGFTPLTPEQSVTQMRARIEESTLTTSGAFIAYDGARLPW